MEDPITGCIFSQREQGVDPTPSNRVFVCPIENTRPVKIQKLRETSLSDHGMRKLLARDVVEKKLLD